MMHLDKERIVTTGIADIVRKAFKRGLNRFINRQTSYDSDVFRYTQASQRGYGGLFAGESCRLSPVICSYDEQCCSGRCLCRRWLTMGEERYLIKYQRLLLSEYHRQSNRYYYKLFTDKKTLENYGYFLLRSNPNIFVINEKRSNQTFNFHNVRQNHLQHINKHKIDVELQPKQSIISKSLDTPIITLHTCSTLIATGHGIISKIIPVLHNPEQLNYKTIDDEDISLSKTCRQTSNRIVLRRYMNSKSSNNYLFTTSNKRTQEEL
ncbi:unnamed protein product [Adineta steineri]|uniref:Uncharacterized protein n=1 Tax=Adineta steineri TaxID=433720 RepID=A0A814NF50_9BILA|nr:unnamed protein product [Adineta steineri]CAF1093161.1 unnamed protein product [Adineta steineri]CAF1439022.1 unnamed protein product [Adineta steineri]CAF1439351.1 unnamed protein product [Adineta steineri]CAF1443801.1 unnamed protein product [Adineta steineri]